MSEKQVGWSIGMTVALGLFAVTLALVAISVGLVGVSHRIGQLTDAVEAAGRCHCGPDE